MLSQPSLHIVLVITAPAFPSAEKTSSNDTSPPVSILVANLNALDPSSQLNSLFKLYRNFVRRQVLRIKS